MSDRARSTRRRMLTTPSAGLTLLTLFGEYLAPDADGLPADVLGSAMAELGHTPAATRQAMSRAVKDGLITTQRSGGRSRAQPTPATRELLAYGTAQILEHGSPRAWDGSWTVLLLRASSVEDQRRYRLRTELGMAGLGALGNGAWLTPYRDRAEQVAALLAEEGDPDVVLVSGALQGSRPIEELVAGAWDLDAVRSRYEAFCADFGGRRACTPAACFRAWIDLFQAWRTFTFLDPALPAATLGRGWPRERAARIFDRGLRQWREPARAHFGALSRDAD